MALFAILRTSSHQLLDRRLFTCINLHSEDHFTGCLYLHSQVHQIAFQHLAGYADEMVLLNTHLHIIHIPIFEHSSSMSIYVYNSYLAIFYINRML